MRSRRLVAGMLALLLAGCTFNQRGPWVDANGRRLLGSEVIEYDGFVACNQERVVFLEFFGDKYAKDPWGQLGTLTSPVDGSVLEFAVLDSVPSQAEPTGITHAGREIYVGPDRSDYLYIRLPDGRAERWPRAEVGCEE